MRPIEPVMPLFFSTRRNALKRNWEPWSECKIVPSMVRWPTAFRPAATARDAFILESME